MQPRDAPGPPGFAGRTAERAALREALEAARSGRPGAVLVRGEAGVGKTRLVTEACREAEQAGFSVLWGRCLLLGAVSVPYLPLVSAFEGWLRTAAEDDRQVVLQAARELAALVPSLGGRPTDAGQHLTTIDQALAALAGRRPLVLVIDDVQWADETSRDVVSYLLAGLRDQRMLVLLTSRDEQLAEGDPLLGWFADVRRLPVVTELALQRLTLEETGEQASQALGRDPDPELVAELFRRTAGNTYFNELLLREVDPVSERLPEQSSGALREALLASWQGLSGPGRAVSRLLAVAGRPTSSQLLAEVATGHGVRSELVAPALHEAADRGVIEIGERLWFRHPLLAEILPGTLLDEERVRCHAAFVEAHRCGRAAELSTADLARHHDGAGMPAEAFEAYLAGAREAAAVAAFAEQAASMMRAWELCGRVGPEVGARHGSAVALAAEVAFSLRRAGNEVAAADVVSEATALLDQEPDPVARAALLRLGAQLGRVRRESNGSDTTMAVLRLALEECRRAEPGAEMAHVLAQLAFGHAERGELEEAGRLAQQAIELATSSRDLFVLAYALGARSFAGRGSGDLAGCERDAEEAYRVALASGRPEAVGLASITQASVLDHRGRWVECAELLVAGHRKARDGGIVGLAQVLGSYAALYLAHLGRLDEADGVIRRVLATPTRGTGGVHARESALMVALRQGRSLLADGHHARLLELDPDFATGEAPGAAVWCEHALAHGQGERVLQLLEEEVVGEAVRAEPHVGDELLVWAARAAGALARTAGVEQAAGALDRVLRRRSELASPPFADSDQNPVRAAWQALFAAESAELHGAAVMAGRWREAVTATGAAALRFEEARSRLSLARCLFAAGKSRPEAAASLRGAHALAQEMGAAGLADQAETLARIARVSLARPTLPDPVSTPSAMDHAGLTRREREVLQHLVAGRTYAEIATALFISEKTVSVHVSNLLRKTGTASRVEVAAWAESRGTPAAVE